MVRHSHRPGEGAQPMVHSEVGKSAERHAFQTVAAAQDAAESGGVSRATFPTQLAPPQHTNTNHRAAHPTAHIRPRSHSDTTNGPVNPTCAWPSKPSLRPRAPLHTGHPYTSAPSPRPRASAASLTFAARRSGQAWDAHRPGAPAGQSSSFWGSHCVVVASFVWREADGVLRRIACNTRGASRAHAKNMVNAAAQKICSRIHP